MWILRTVGQPAETTFRLLPDSIKSIGRATGADFILDEALVSRLHCRMQVTVSGVTTARLVPGDRLKVGRVELIALKDAE